MDGPLTVPEIKRIVDGVARAFAEVYDEPVPPFETHDSAKLQGALAAPFQSAFEEDIYKTVYTRAGALFYFMAKDHPFANGNKRIAVMVLLYYLAKNNLALNINPLALYKLALFVVEEPQTKEAVISAIAVILEERHISYDEWVKEIAELRKRDAEDGKKT